MRQQTRSMASLDLGGAQAAGERRRNGGESGSREEREGEEGLSEVRRMDMVRRKSEVGDVLRPTHQCGWREELEIVVEGRVEDGESVERNSFVEESIKLGHPRTFGGNIVFLNNVDIISKSMTCVASIETRMSLLFEFVNGQVSVNFLEQFSANNSKRSL